ncbi:hypothetical protein ACFCX4_30590, partial [Kitasatospora sp. NPDC056327]|uniref:hypothetical protein n=1 Tax=Kitasatospora sp. NPDC056327 TaxID=3345785 RepID=UPI0035E2B9BA
RARRRDRQAGQSADVADGEAAPVAPSAGSARSCTLARDERMRRHPGAPGRGADRGPRVQRLKRALSAGLGGIGALALSGCLLSDPEPLLAGFRISQGRVEVVFPLCPGESVIGVRGADVTGKRRELFGAAGPVSAEAAAGRVVILGTPESGDSGWVPQGFAERTVHEEPPVLPKHLEIGYRSTAGAAGDVADTEKAAAAAPGAGQYWTHKGARTAEQIGRQLKCATGPAF